VLTCAPVLSPIPIAPALILRLGLGLGLAAAPAAAGCTRPKPPAPAAAAPPRSHEPAPTVRFTLAAPERAELVSPAWTFHSLALSPDGRFLAFVARREPQAEPTLWIRPLDWPAPRSLGGTEGALSPFFSPDGTQIGFFAGGKLKKAKTGGGPVATVTTLCDAAPGAGSGTWNRQGTIVFAAGGRAGNRSDIYRVADGGGDPVPLTDREPGMHLWPQFLPDGRHYLRLVRGDSGPAAIVVATIDGSDQRRPIVQPVFENDSLAWFAQGFLLYVREGMLLARPFDPGALRFTGEPFQLAKHLLHFVPTGHARFAASDTGVIVYSDGEDLTRLAWFTRKGEPAGAVGSPADFRAVRLSGDGKRLLTAITDRRTGTADLWLHDLGDSNSSHLTTDPGSERSPVWSPDEGRIAFGVDRGGGGGGAGGGGSTALRVLALRGAPEARPADLLGVPGGGDQAPADFSPDGRQLLVVHTDRATGDQDLWLVPAEGSGVARPWRKTAARERDPRFSPDGRWVAFVSDETGRAEVYVRALAQQPVPASPSPSGNDARLVSSGGGTQPRWRRDGKELFYLAADGALMAVPVAAGDRKLATGKPSRLFDARPPEIPGFEVAADGQRFLIPSPDSKVSTTPLTVIVNWTAPLAGTP
jgi:eukaryotic-like serine/threonine-protein kinase